MEPGRAETQTLLADVGFFYIITRGALLLLAVASRVFPVNGGPIRSIAIYPAGPVVAANPRFLQPFANWDGDHYMQIAGGGYAGAEKAFFPLYPLLVHILSLAQPRWTIAAGMLINLVAVGAAALLMARLVAGDWPRMARTAVVLLLLYPGAVFLTFTYGEALALLFFVGAALAARRKHWWLAGAIGALAAASRPTGVVIVILLLVEYLLEQRPRRLVHLPALFIPIVGTAAYGAYLWLTVGDPLAFIHAEQPFGRGLGILPVEFSNGHWLTSPSFGIWVVAMAAALWSIRVVRPSYGAFAAALLLAAPLTGAFGSTSRHLLLAWPVFVMLARYLNTERRMLVTASVFSMFLAFFLLLFVHGYWVA